MLKGIFVLASLMHVVKSSDPSVKSHHTSTSLGSFLRPVFTVYVKTVTGHPDKVGSKLCLKKNDENPMHCPCAHIWCSMNVHDANSPLFHSQGLVLYFLDKLALFDEGWQHVAILYT